MSSTIPSGKPTHHGIAIGRVPVCCCLQRLQDLMVESKVLGCSLASIFGSNTTPTGGESMLILISVDFQQSAWHNVLQQANIKESNNSIYHSTTISPKKMKAHWYRQAPSHAPFIVCQRSSNNWTSWFFHSIFPSYGPCLNPLEAQTFSKKRSLFFGISRTLGSASEA